jgi:HD-like signal output (HDOD) protein
MAERFRAQIHVRGGWIDDRERDRHMIEDGTSGAVVRRDATSIDAVVRKVAEVSTLPHVALRVIAVAKNPGAGAADLRIVVEGDPALGARVLRMVNAAAYGVRSTVTDLHQAISFLGFSQVRNLALTASVAEVFKRNERVGTYQRSMLWRHMVSVGICARLVASRCRMPNFEDAFLAGLLHDIGIVIEDQHVHKRFCQMIRGLFEGAPLCAIENEYLGFDHCRLGERIAEVWRFPPTVQAAIRYHHESHRYGGEGCEIVRCVEIANVVCTLKGISSVGMRLVEPPLEALKMMGFRKDDVVILAADLDRELVLNRGLFEL